MGCDYYYPKGNRALRKGVHWKYPSSLHVLILLRWSLNFFQCFPKLCSYLHFACCIFWEGCFWRLRDYIRYVHTLFQYWKDPIDEVLAQSLQNSNPMHDNILLSWRYSTFDKMCGEYAVNSFSRLPYNMFFQKNLVFSNNLIRQC